MPYIREFNGQVVRRTIRVGDQVALVLKSPEKGKPGQRLLLSVDEYRTGLKTHRSDNKAPVAA
ncbi:MAG: hypothetical protein JNM56_26065 [Planctomycetia bacterium]|nr:hypothetical protein [Planctomycetia bacterium]